MSFSGSNDMSRSWEDKLSSFSNVFKTLEVDRSWCHEPLSAPLERALGALEVDLADLEKTAGFIFSTETETENITRQNVDLLRRWQSGASSPSLTALCLFTIQHYGLEKHEDLVQSILIASVLGEADNDLPYHSNMHFRKVLLQTIRLIAAHNSIYAGTSRAFDERKISWLLIAACIHDLGHDGQGNTVKGVFYPSRLEKQSYEIAEPYLKMTGLDEEGLRAVKIMLLCTDVTPLSDPGNPVGQVKTAYRYHFQGHQKDVEQLNLDGDLKPLEKDPDLTTMGLLLHEADIATSGGLSYDVTKYETTLYRQEICDEEAQPRHVVDFLNQICRRHMLSDAAQRLYAANLARIYALAEEDVAQGNEPFPRAELSDFILGGAVDEDGSSKTIN